MSSSIEPTLQTSGGTAVISAPLNTGVWGFEILEGQSNYNIWAKRFRIGIDYEGFSRALDEKRPVDKDAEWEKFHRRAIGIFYSKIDAPILALVEACDCLNEGWELLKQQYKDTGYTAKHHLVSNLASITLASCNDDVDTYIRAIMTNKREQTELECGLPEWYFITILINNLNGKYPIFAQNTTLKKKQPSFETVAAELREVGRMEANQEVSANRAQWKKGAKGQQGQQGQQGQDQGKNNGKTPKKDKNKGNKNSGGGKKCKKHPDQDRHGDADCWEQHPELTPDHIKARAKKTPDAKIPEAKVANAAAFRTSAFLTQSQAFIGQKGWKAHIAATAAKAKSTQSIWIVDSGCSHTMTPSRDNFIEYSSLTKHVPVETANGHHMKAIGVGKVLIEGELPDGATAESNVSDVLHVPELSIGLLSVRMLTKRGAKVIFEDDVCLIQDTDRRQVMHAIEHRRQYEIQQFRSQALVTSFATKFNEETLQLWHRRTGHLNNDDLKRLVTMTSGIDLTHAIKHKHLCGSCMKGKHTRKPSRRPQQPVSELLGCIDSDVGGAITPQSIGGKRYFVIFTDRASGAAWGYLMAKKSDVFPIFTKQFQPLVENQSGKRIKRWRTDHGTEVENKLMSDWSSAHGIQWEPSAPYSPEQNGIAERQNRTVVEKLRAMLDDAGLADNLWGEMFHTAIYLRNRSPATRLRLRGINKTPYEVWTGHKPELGHLRIIGCDAWHHIPKELPGQKKLSDRAVKCQLLGYVGTNQFRLWNPTSRKIIISRDVAFDESKMLGVLDTADCHWGDEDGHDVAPQGGEKSNGVATSPPSPPAGVFDEFDPEIASSDADEGPDANPQDVGPDANPPADAGPDEDQPQRPADDAENRHPSPPADATITLRRSAREKRPTRKAQENSQQGNLAKALITNNQLSDQTIASETAYCRLVAVAKTDDDYTSDFDPQFDFNRLLDRVLAYSTNREISSMDDEPLNYKEAMAGPFADQWKLAGDTEMQDLESIGTYVRIKRSEVPKGARILSTRLVYKLKRDLNGQIARYKARCVVRGFMQQAGVDYHETFASVVKAMSFKALFAIVAKLDLDCEQIDIKTAFLNSTLQEKVYAAPPEGYEDPGYVWLLKRALYGLKQSPREWYTTLKNWLEKQGFQHTNADHSVFTNKEKQLILAIYVDDLLIVGPPSSPAIAQLKKDLSSRFKMTDMGPCYHYLGMMIIRDRANRTLTLSQRAYLEKVLDRFGMKDCKPSPIPMVVGTQLVPETDHQATASEITEYQSIIGSLMYAMVETRPDIAYAVTVLSRFSLNPNKQHFIAAKHVLRYIRGSLDVGITYGGNSSLVGYTDADWAGDVEGRRSTGAYLFTLFGGAISWSSKRQPTVALSSCEAEYMAQTQASKEAIWIKRLLTELDLYNSLTSLNTSPVLINADNQGAIALSKDPKYHSRTKHIDVQWHFVREQVESGAITFTYCPTDEMAADGLTKPLDRIKFSRFFKLTGMTTS